MIKDFRKQNNWIKAVNNMVREYKKLECLIFNPILGLHKEIHRRIIWDEWQKAIKSQ